MSLFGGANLIPKKGVRRQLHWAAAVSALALLVTIALVARQGQATTPSERLGLLDGSSLWAQLLSGASARAHTVQSSLADDIRVAEESIAQSSGNVRDGSKEPSQQLRRDGIAAPQANAASFALLGARQQLGLAVAQAADGERQAIKQERKAQAGIAAETALAKAFRAERRSNKVRLSAALRAMADEAAAGEGSLLGAGGAISVVTPAPPPMAAPVFTDQELRADITRLEGDLGVQPKGVVARTKKAAAAQQKKLAGQGQSSKVDQELVAMRKELNSFKGELVQARKVQVLRESNGRSSRSRISPSRRATRTSAHSAYSSDHLSTVASDESHCLNPMVWANGECFTSPRGRQETNVEEQRACGNGEQTSQCRTFRSNEARKLAEYERDLRASSDYNYPAANRNPRYNNNRASARSSGSSTSQSSGSPNRRMAGNPRMGSMDYDLRRAVPRNNNQTPEEFERHLTELEKEMAKLDDFTGDLEPNEFVMQPQRFPHRDGADLGDNYIGSFSDTHPDANVWSSDRIVPVSEAAQRQPAEFATFLGRGRRIRAPMFASRDLTEKNIERLKKNKNLLRYADKNDAFGKHSPLNKSLRRTMFGNADPYFADKYGFPGDVLPSSKQYQAQVLPVLSASRLAAQSDRKRDTVYNPAVRQRWRKEKHCVGSECRWKPVLEDKDVACEQDTCSETCKGHNCGADPIKLQMSQGAIDGHADPFGAAAVFDDDEMPAEAVSLDKGLRSHFRQKTGEPLGDAAMRGWDMQNGNDYETDWDHDGHAHNNDYLE